MESHLQLVLRMVECPLTKRQAAHPTAILEEQRIQTQMHPRFLHEQRERPERLQPMSQLGLKVF